MTQVTTFVFVELAGRFVPAGRLVMNDDERRAPWGRFAYGRRYLERADAMAVDPVKLPLGEAEYFTDEGFVTFGAIEDAAPDGWGKYLMYKAMEDRTPTDVEAILASGPERVGALAFGPTPDRPERIVPWNAADDVDYEFSLEELAKATQEALEVDRLPPNLRALLTAGSSLGGARPKGVTKIDGRDWIAKFPARQDAIPEARVEYAAMLLAGRLGLDVPPIELTVAADRDIYLIRRFDRDEDGRRSHFISGLTLLAAHESEFYRFGYGDLAEKLRRHGASPARDASELFRRMVYNILVSNDDDHLRNHGFLLGETGWSLSPLYDVVPKPQLAHERNLSLVVGPQGRTASLVNAVAGAARFDLSRAEATGIALELAFGVRDGWEDAFREAGLGAPDRERFATCFRMAEPENHGLARQ